MADGQQTATTNKPAEVEVKPLTLAQRLAAIREEAHGIGKTDIDMKAFKDGKEVKWTIKSHTVDAVLSEMRPLLAKHGVGLLPQLVERTYAGNRCDAIFDFEFMDMVSGETRVIRWAGCGTDNGDKALAKAGTGALKEMLKKVFLITDKEDAKTDTETVEHQTDEGVRRGDMEKVKEQRKAAIRQWATTFKAAVEGAKTEKEIDRIYRENHEQLDADDLEPVTKEFFAELKVTAKGRLLAADEPGARG